MGTVHSLRGNDQVRSLKLLKKEKHTAWIKVTDGDHPKRTAENVRFAIRRAAGIPATRGFTDKAAKAGRWHRIRVRQPYIARFAIRDLGPLVAAGLVKVEIDGRELRAREAA